MECHVISAPAIRLNVAQAAYISKNFDCARVSGHHVFRHQNIVPYASKQQHTENGKCLRRGWLENQIPALYRTVGWSGVTGHEDNSIRWAVPFCPFKKRPCCTEHEVPPLVLMGYHLPGRANNSLGSLMVLEPAQLPCDTESFTCWP